MGYFAELGIEIGDEPIKNNANFRVIGGYGPYMNKRYEVQRKDFYGWHMVFHSSKLSECEEYFDKYKDEEREVIKAPLELFNGIQLTR